MEEKCLSRAENIIKYPQGFRVVHYRLFRREVFDKVDLQDSRIPYVEDLDLFLRMELAGMRLSTIPLVDDAFILHD
ncbi:MAG: hypothetical protein ACPLSO_07145 [Fervidicoccaceae archaeon]